MSSINNEKFGAFVAERRKALGLTQKELGDLLFVSDKTVSKWERGASLPNIALLQPLAEVLNVSVTALLNGEELTSSQTLATSDAEKIVVTALDFSLRDILDRERRRWLVLFCLTCAIVITELVLLKTFASPPPDTSTVLFSALFLGIAAWGCFFAKPLLPSYYDNNKIHYVQQGPFRLNMIGLSFNNGNWPYILNWLRIATLLLSVVYPLIPLAAASTNIPEQAFIVILLLLLFCPLYIIGKKYE